MKTLLRLLRTPKRRLITLHQCHGKAHSRANYIYLHYTPGAWYEKDTDNKTKVKRDRVNSFKRYAEV